MGGRARIEMDYRVTIPRCEGRFGYGGEHRQPDQLLPRRLRVWEDGAFDLTGTPPWATPSTRTWPTTRRCSPCPPATRPPSPAWPPPRSWWATGGCTPPPPRGAGLRLDRQPQLPDPVRPGGRGADHQLHRIGRGVRGPDAAKAALRAYNRRFGCYPYPTYSVVACDFYIGGMEYPNLVMIDQSLYHQERAETLEFVVAHETAHQWWYQMVGNDEVAEPWLDESLTNYLPPALLPDTQGPEAFEAAYEKLRRPARHRRPGHQPARERIQRPVRVQRPGVQRRLGPVAALARPGGRGGL